MWSAIGQICRGGVQHVVEHPGQHRTADPTGQSSTDEWELHPERRGPHDAGAVTHRGEAHPSVPVLRGREAAFDRVVEGVRRVVAGDAFPEPADRPEQDAYRSLSIGACRPGSASRCRSTNGERVKFAALLMNSKTSSCGAPMNRSTVTVCISSPAVWSGCGWWRCRGACRDCAWRRAQ